MAAIITDQLRVLTAKLFVENSTDPNNSYYSFIGLTNPEDILSNWDTNPPAPKDCLNEENKYWDTTIALKKITSDNVRLSIKRYQWESGEVYDMYRHDISRTNLSKPSNSTTLYRAPYYIINSDYKVYICLQNGTTPETPKGSPSLDEPTFTDLEPKEAGTSGDGYVWKYLYTIKPADIIKFDSLNFVPTPENWSTNDEYTSIRNNAENSGQLKIVTITNRGSGIGTANAVYTNVPINGDGTGAEATIVIDNDSKIESITVAKGGSGYTFGTVDLVKGNVPEGTINPTFDVIIPPKGGHGADLYTELGAFNVLLYTRIENDELNPDFITGNKISQLGIIQNPTSFNSSVILNEEKVSALYALRLAGSSGVVNTAVFEENSFVYQTIGLGVTSVGRVVSYDQQTGVLKLWQDRTFVGFTTSGERVSNPPYGFKLNAFTSNPDTGGSLTITGGSANLDIDPGFSGVSTTINNAGNFKTYYLGQTFINGIANPEVQKYSGTTLYVDNRPSITRSKSQKEDIKVILQF